MADTDELCDQPKGEVLRPVWDRVRARRKARVSPPSDRMSLSGARRPLFARSAGASAIVTISNTSSSTKAHRGSDRNKIITDYFAPAKVCGITATAFRARMANLSAYYESVAFEMGMFDLIDEGYIAPIKVLTLLGQGRHHPGSPDQRRFRR